jgi:hypothetical protein
VQRYRQLLHGKKASQRTVGSNKIQLRNHAGDIMTATAKSQKQAGLDT